MDSYSVLECYALTSNLPFSAPLFRIHFNCVILSEPKALSSILIANAIAVKEESQGNNANSLAFAVAPLELSQWGGFLHTEVDF